MRDDDDLKVEDITAQVVISISVGEEVFQTHTGVSLVGSVCVPSGKVTQKIGTIPEKVGCKVDVRLAVH